MICRWYFPDTKRLDAEKLLLSEGNQHGAFLIRNCESQKGELSLSGNSNSNGRCFICVHILCMFIDATDTTAFVICGLLQGRVKVRDNMWVPVICFLEISHYSILFLTSA